MTAVSVLTVLLVITMNMVFSSRKYHKKNHVNNFSWGNSDDSFCPDFSDYATAYNIISTDDGSSLQDLYISNSDYRACSDGDIENGCISNATDRVDGLLFFASVSSSSDIQFENEKYGQYYASADWKFNIVCQSQPFTVYGTVSFLCDQSGKIVEEYPLSNLQQRAAMTAVCQG